MPEKLSAPEKVPDKKKKKRGEDDRKMLWEIEKKL